MTKYRKPHEPVTLEAINKRTVRIGVTTLPIGCLEWQGARTKAGYGQLNVEGRSEYVHRLVFKLIHGNLPTQVIHSCDNPPCCEPSHLLKGNATVNALDMVNKRRNKCPIGTAARHAKLNPEKIRDIRKRLAKGESQKSIAELFKVSRPQISYIHHRRTWKHVKD